MTEVVPLKCEECGREQIVGERGWRAYLTVDDEAVVYCPQCATREFDSDYTRFDART